MAVLCCFCAVAVRSGCSGAPGSSVHFVARRHEVYDYQALMITHARRRLMQRIVILDLQVSPVEDELQEHQLADGTVSIGHQHGVLHVIVLLLLRLLHTE
jgi:hypothetical protein